MIGQMTVLLRLKTIKEEQALRVLRAKRRQVAEGEAALEQARQAVDASARTLDAREDAIYESILGQVVDLGALDDTRGAALALAQAHSRLADASNRAAYNLERLTGECAAAAERHRAATRVRDKYAILRDDLGARADAEAQAREENEVEELFCRRRPDPAGSR
jgi:hypothetical protein